MFFRKILCIGSVACGALVGAAGLASIADAQPRDPSTSVADDGTTTFAPRLRATTSRSFPGAGRELSPGEKDDARATPESRIDEERTERRLRNAKPVRSTSAREGGDQTIESVIGSDDRTRVTPTTRFPARATVLILFSDGGSDFLCSGFMISADTVATAGHCLAPGDGTGFYDSTTYRVFPGRDGRIRPYGVCGARTLYSVDAWLDLGRDDFDYGAIKLSLNCDIGTTTGWYGFTATYDGVGTPVTVQGYPGDKPQTQWQSKDRIRREQVRRLFYRNDTTGGMSGSPVWTDKGVGSGCRKCAVAIHGYGTGGTGVYATNNHGPRITQAVFDNLTLWKNAP